MEAASVEAVFSLRTTERLKVSVGEGQSVGWTLLNDQGEVNLSTDTKTNLIFPLNQDTAERGATKNKSDMNGVS